MPSSRRGQPGLDARRLIDAGVTGRPREHRNPGRATPPHCLLCIALAVREMGMTPLEEVLADTPEAPQPYAATTWAASRSAAAPTW